MEPLPWYRIAAPLVFVAVLAGVCIWKNLPRFRAMLLGIVIMSTYAAIQDQFSVRLCPEYFTHFHNPIVGLTDPTAMGVVWGFLGSWWGGALLGYFAGIAATVGTRPVLPVTKLVLPMLLVMLGMAVVTALTGLSVSMYAEAYVVSLNRIQAEVVPIERRTNLLVVSCYHLVAYASAIIGSIVLCVWVGWCRNHGYRRGDATNAITATIR